VFQLEGSLKCKIVEHTLPINACLWWKVLRDDWGLMSSFTLSAYNVRNLRVFRYHIIFALILASHQIRLGASSLAIQPIDVPVISQPPFLDCTGEEHGDWALFREMFQTVVVSPFIGQESADLQILPFDPDLLTEALRLVNKWQHYLAKFNEDYPPGSAIFYHSCHWNEHEPYCLYGHIAAMAYLTQHINIQNVRYDLARSALRLLNWNYCLDFLESSSWRITILDLLEIVGEHIYPQVTLMHSSLEVGPGTGTQALGSQQDSTESDETTNQIYVFELGQHRALSNEPVSLLQSVLPKYSVAHMNYLKPYEGRAEVYNHPFPRSCSPNCKDQQDSAPYSFPVFEKMHESRREWQKYMTTSILNKAEVRQSSVFLCTTPIYYCSFFAGLNRTIFGYFGLPLLYMVPIGDWDPWLKAFVDMAKSPLSVFLANNQLLAEQIVWQSGLRLRVLQPVTLYIKDTYFPSHPKDVLVPEPREACVLNCLLRSFTPPGYPLSFFAKKDTDRTYKTFSTFRAVVLFPHDIALMTFYEFYAMSMPLFLPSHLSKYIFPYSATVHLLDWVPNWVISNTAASKEVRPSLSPLKLTTAASLRHWSRFMDFFNIPAVQFFASFAELLRILPIADLHGISSRMRENHMSRVVDALAFWRAATLSALSLSATEL